MTDEEKQLAYCRQRQAYARAWHEANRMWQLEHDVEWTGDQNVQSTCPHILQLLASTPAGHGN